MRGTAAVSAAPQSEGRHPSRPHFPIYTGCRGAAAFILSRYRKPWPTFKRKPHLDGLGARRPGVHGFLDGLLLVSYNHAIGQAFRLVRDGEADLAVTGGSEAPFTIGLLKAWEAMRVIAPDTCRPFSKDRRGMILGEGAAMMILEPSRRGTGARCKDLRRDLRHGNDV